MMHMPKPISDLVSLIGKYSRNIVGALRQGGRFGKAGMIEPLSPELRNSMDGFLTQLKSLARTENQMARDVDTLMRLQALEPEGFRALQRESSQVPIHGKPDPDPTLAKEYKDIELFFRRQMDVEAPGRRGALRRGLSTLARLIEPMHQVAARKPLFADMIHLMSDAMASVASNSARIKAAMMTKLDVDGVTRIATKDFKHLEAVTNPGKVKNVFDNLARWQNENEALLDRTNPEVKAQLDSLSKAQQLEVVGALEAVQASLKEIWGVVGRNRSAIGELAIGTTLLARMPELRANQAHELGRAVWKVQELLASTDPVALQQAQALGADIATKIPAEALVDVMDMGRQLHATNVELMEFLNSRPWFMTERRFGDHQISYQIEGAKETGRVAGETPAKAEAAYKRATQGKKVIKGSKTYERVSDRTFLQGGEQMLAKVREIDQQQQVILKRTLEGLPDGVELFNELQPHLDTGSRLARDLAAKDIGGGKPRRQLREGRESLNMFETHARFIDALVRGEAHKYLRHAKSLHTLDPELRNDPDTLRQAKSAIDNYLEADTGAGSAITKANFVYYLGMNLSSHMLEGGAIPVLSCSKPHSKRCWDCREL